MTSADTSTTTTPDAAASDDERPRPVTPRRGDRLRAALIVNPYSSGMTSKRERKIVLSLRERMDVDVHRTQRSGHAPLIVQELMGSDASPDVVISCGGDGTANEILNGMSLGNDTADERPAFAIIPGGGTNVLARSLGFPNHPVRATSQLADAIIERRHRAINLATVDERLFMFSAGVGLDAEVVKRMEERRSGRRPSDTAHVASILGIYAQARFALGERMTIRIDDTDEELRAALLLVGNTTPMTYVGRMPMHFMPDCSLEMGLDILAPKRANAGFAMRNAAQAMGVGRKKQTLVNPEKGQLRHDLSGFTVTCDDPQPVQVDGEYIGDRTDIRFGLLRRAVNLVC